MKIVKYIFLIIWTFYSIIEITKNFKYYNFVDWTIVIIVVLIPYITVCIFNKKRSASNEAKQISNTNDTSTQNKYIDDKGKFSETDKKHFQSSAKNIQDTNKYYDTPQILLLLQHINDSYKIICSTEKPETLCSRYEFGLKRCCELKELEENGLYHGDHDANYYLSLFSPENYQNFILSCYDRYLDKAKSELKTEKSIDKRIDKFWEVIKSHIDEFTYSELRKTNNTRYQQNNISFLSNTKHIIDNNEDTMSYVETDTLIYRTDGQPISDEEVPYLMQLGYEEAMKKNGAYNGEILDLSFMQARDKNKREYTRIPTYDELSDIEASETSVSLGEILFLEYLNGFPLKNPLIAQKWYYEYNLNHTKTIKKLISNGLLTIEHASIDRLNVGDLKKILKKFNQPTNGKKADLQSRIYANVSQKEIDDYFDNAKFFSVTLKGKELIKIMEDD